MDPTDAFNQQFEAKFGEDEIAMQGHGTPGTPRFKIVSLNDENKIPVVSQSRYWSSVGWNALIPH
jgi:hypothetical protein